MEKRQLLAGATLALAATCAQAQETTWRVEFIDVLGRTTIWGLEPNPPSPFTPITLSGLVKGEDRNRDGWIDRSELNELTFGHDGVSGNYATCGTWGDINNHCTLDHFVFAPEGPLGPSFEMTGQWNEGLGSLMERKVRTETGAEYNYAFYKGRYGAYFWTEDTTLRITQVSVVPEPAAGMMLAAGLAALMGARRRRPA